MLCFLRKSVRSSKCLLKHHHIRYLANKTVKDYYDVTIVGGGMVGSALALSLGFENVLKDKKILILEAAPKKSTSSSNLPEKYSNRVSSVTPGSRKLLESIGVWDHICKMRSKPYRRLQVWDACSDGQIIFDASTAVDDASNMGYIIENDVVSVALRKQLHILHPRVDVMYETKLKDLRFPQLPLEIEENHNCSSPWVSVELDNGKTFETGLIIGADGPSSAVRRIADVEHLSWSYGQYGVVATLHLGEITENLVGWQKFLPTGPIALLPLTENLSSLVWSTSLEHAKRLVTLPEDAFIDAVNNAFWEDMERNAFVDEASHFFNQIFSILQPSQLGARQTPPSISGVDEKSRAMFPLGLGHATHYVKPRMALVGDAAHRVHPLAGQGVNLGFGDVLCLKDVLVSAAEEGQDLGSLSNLLQYETERQQNVVPMMATIDLLKRLFSTSSTPVVLARTLGLNATNALLPLKEQIVKFAMR